MALCKRNGCRHCVACNGISNWLQQNMQRSPYDTYVEPLSLWPAGLASPTVYYAVRERQLSYQIHLAASQAAALWRPQLAPPAAAPLLRRRSCAPLSVRVPCSATGVDAADSVVYLRSVDVACCVRPTPGRPTPLAAAPAAAAAAKAAAAKAQVVLPPPAPLSVAAWAPAPQAVPVYRLATPPTHEQQPAAKRIRLDASAVCIAPVPRAAPLITPSMWASLLGARTSASASASSSSSSLGGSSAIPLRQHSAPAMLPVALCTRPVPAAAPASASSSCSSWSTAQQQWERQSQCQPQQRLQWQHAQQQAPALAQQQQRMQWQPAQPHAPQQHAPQQHAPQQQGAGADDPHGLMAWLGKIRHILDHSPAQVPAYS